jgi:FMN phosphatase YigB (HAD superfamily)
MSRAVLLDVDGVIFNDRILMKEVKHNIAKFVQSRVEPRNKRLVSYDEAQVITANMYKNYGHTLVGMWKVYGYSEDLSIDRFNDQVYPKETLNNLHSFLRHSRCPNRSILSYFSTQCMESLIPLGIFSNAPNEWCEPIYTWCNLDVASDLTFTSSHRLFTDKQQLKPVEGLYDDIYKSVAEYYDVSRITFIDDSPLNLSSLWEKPEWAPLHFINNDVFLI